MPGQGLQNIPIRIPSTWDAAWFDKFIREVLALADTRNAIQGSGIVITGQSGEPATISTSADVQNLLLQSYVVASASGFLSFERVLTGNPGEIFITDGGANSSITVGVLDRGLILEKLQNLREWGVLGNPTDASGPVQNLIPTGDKAVLHVNATDIVFDLIDHTYVSDFDEAAQDAVGMILTDSTSIDFTYDDGANTITASTINANPSGLIGMSSVNGTAATPLRSDGLHAIDPAIAPEWTGTHGWADSAEVQLGAGNDLRLFHDGTDSWVRNDTGIMKLAAGAASVFEVTAARGTMNLPLRLKGYTVATLPAGTVGDTAYVTDALAPVFLGIVAGGGAITTTVFYNSTNWIVQ